MMTEVYIPLLYAFVAAYLIGSIPFGLLLTRLAGLGDIRAIGSGNIGATNVLRTGRKGLAALTLLLDGLKGFAAVVLVRHYMPALPPADSLLGLNGHMEMFTALAAFGAVLGHVFPVWLKFNGGKGVATAFGSFFGLFWPLGVLACLVWILAAIVFRYSSLSAILALLVVSAFSVCLPTLSGEGYGPFRLVPLFITALVLLRHRANISRLLKGTEPKIGQKS